MLTTLLVLTVGLTACLGQDNVLQVAEKLGCMELGKLVELAGLTSALSGTGPFTVFAPTDEAFHGLPRPIVDRLANNKTALGDVLKYHVLSGKVITVDGSPVVKPDQMASNGIVHLVDRVLFPIPEGTVTQLVSRQKELSTLLTAVQKANLTSALSGDGPFTLFAPTNEAFQRLPPGTLQKLLANVTALTNVLTYHVVKGTYFTPGLSNELKLDTLSGKSVQIETRGRDHVEVNQAHLEGPDMPVTNGVVHLISSVLIPPEIVQELNFSHYYF